MRRSGELQRAARLPTAIWQAAVLALAALTICACGDERAQRDTVVATCPALPSTCPAELPSYANEVAPIIAAHCGQCHSSHTSGPWPFTNVNDISDWALSIQVDLEDCLMPPPDTDAPLSNADRETLYVWLKCGAPNN